MRIRSIIENAESWNKLAKDPRTSKLLSIAFKQDPSIPLGAISKAGINPTDEQIVKIFGQLVDKTLTNTKFGDVSRDGKFDDWVARKYMEGYFDYEDLSGEAGDALGAWKALSIRGFLKPEHQDFNRFNSLKKLQTLVMQNDFYRDKLKRIQDSERIEKAKRDQKSITLIDDENFYVMIPLNYGACYVFNNAEGITATFCTGSSGGMNWFDRYNKDGPMISVLDKNNMEDVWGKWQIHAATDQFQNARQQTYSYGSGARQFAQRFPGLMDRIIAAISDKSEQIKAAGHDPDKAINDIKRKFPQAFVRPEETPAG